MKTGLYTLYLFILGVVSLFTREIVTFIMLGVILISLTNIHSTLKELLKIQKDRIG